MADRPTQEFGEQTSPHAGEAMRMGELEDWFVREVLPLEGVLIQYLNRGARSKADAEDLRQDLYERVCTAVRDGVPNSTRSFVFTIARNLLIDRVRHEQVVPFDTVENLDELNIAIDEPAADRVVVARQELRRLQAALEKLPVHQREAVVMRKLNGLSVHEIAQRAGIAERTVREHLADGVRTLADILYREYLTTERKL